MDFLQNFDIKTAFEKDQKLHFIGRVSLRLHIFFIASITCFLGYTIYEVMDLLNELPTFGPTICGIGIFVYVFFCGTFVWASLWLYFRILKMNLTLSASEVQLNIKKDTKFLLKWQDIKMVSEARSWFFQKPVPTDQSNWNAIVITTKLYLEYYIRPEMLKNKIIPQQQVKDVIFLILSQLSSPS